MKIDIPSKLSEQDIIELNKELSKEGIEICGIIDGGSYLVLGAGTNACMFQTDIKDHMQIFHTHPEDEPPSPIDLQTMFQLCGKMEIFTPNNKYVVINECKDSTLIISRQQKS